MPPVRHFPNGLLHGSGGLVDGGGICQPLCRVAQTGGVESQFGKQFVAVAVFDELVGNAKDADPVRGKTKPVGGLQNSAAEAPVDGVLFDRDHKTVLNSAPDDVLINRFDKSSLFYHYRWS